MSKKKLTKNEEIIKAAIEAVKFIQFGELIQVGKNSINLNAIFKVGGFSVVLDCDLRSGNRKEYVELCNKLDTRWVIILNKSNNRARACSKRGLLITGMEYTHAFSDESYAINYFVRTLNEELKK